MPLTKTSVLTRSVQPVRCYGTFAEWNRQTCCILPDA
jgi:hypothetical protein